MNGVYWPWWLGALALGSAATLHARALHKPLGVSGSVRRVVDAASDRRLREADAMMSGSDDDAAALEAAMLAATERAFGAVAIEDTATEAPAPAAIALPASRDVPWTAHLLFLVAMVVGAFIAVASSGSLHVRVAPAAAYQHFVAHGGASYLTLALGGVCVGFGTRMSGGCTSGHGLNGCSQLFPASLAATCVFFGSGVALSFALEVLAR